MIAIKKLLSILTRAEKNRFKMLFLAILVMALLEVIGIASIFPFMQLVSDPGVVNENPLLFRIYQTFGFESIRGMLIAAGSAVLVLIALANAFSVFTTWLQHKYAWEAAHHISTRLLRNYLSRPYDYFLTNNTSDLLTKTLTEVGHLAIGVLITSVEFAARSIVSLVIFGLLIAVDPQIALVVSGVLGGAYGIIYLARRRYLLRLGEEKLEANFGRFKSLNEVLTGVKTFRVYEAQDYFYRRFERSSARYTDVQPRVFLVTIAPRYLLEVLAFGGIIALILFLLVREKDLQAALPILSLYALSGSRLLPALQKAFAALARLRHTLPVVDKLHADLTVQQPGVPTGPHPDSIGPFSRQFVLDDITFFYENSPEPVLQGLSATIPKGQTLAFVGETGSGKTTIVDLMVGLLHTQSGEIRIDGQQLLPTNVREWRRQIGYVSQEVFLFDDTVARNIAIGQQDDEIDWTQMARATRLAKIDEFITDELPDGYQTDIGERGVRLSGGQRQRLGLARALYRSPAVLILDEATSALDNITEKAVIDCLKKEAAHLTVILIAHRLSTVRHADCIYLLQKGRIIAEGSYDILLSKSAVFREMAHSS